MKFSVHLARMACLPGQLVHSHAYVQYVKLKERLATNPDAGICLAELMQEAAFLEQYVGCCVKEIEEDAHIVLGEEMRQDRLAGERQNELIASIESCLDFVELNLHALLIIAEKLDKKRPQSQSLALQKSALLRMAEAAFCSELKGRLLAQKDLLLAAPLRGCDLNAAFVSASEMGGLLRSLTPPTPNGQTPPKPTHKVVLQKRRRTPSLLTYKSPLALTMHLASSPDTQIDLENAMLF